MSYLLVDGGNLIMRYASAMLPDAFADLTAEEIEKVVVAATNAALRCAEASHSTHMIVALDSEGTTWRHEIFPQYKAHRKQSGGVWCERFAAHLNDHAFKTVTMPGFEADEIISTLSARLVRVGKQVAVLSGDSDLLQLASLQVYVYQFGKHPEPKYVNRSLAWIREKYELTTAGHFTAYKALVGEPGDGLPGVAGIGPVKARKLLARYSVEALSSAPEIDAPAFKLALLLVTLRDDVPIGSIDPKECRITTPRT